MRQQTPPDMPRSRTLFALSLATALVPFTLYSVLRSGAIRRSDLLADLDPFEVNLQLMERND